MVEEFISEVRFWDKGKALERMSKLLGLYAEDNSQQNEGLRTIATVLQEIGQRSGSGPALPVKRGSEVNERLAFNPALEAPEGSEDAEE